jgi:hypothetical protein
MRRSIESQNASDFAGAKPINSDEAEKRKAVCSHP